MQGCLGNLRRTVPREGARGISPMHKVPEREDEPMNVSQQRDQWWPGRASGRRHVGSAETTEGRGRVHRPALLCVFTACTRPRLPLCAQRAVCGSPPDEVGPARAVLPPLPVFLRGSCRVLPQPLEGWEPLCLLPDWRPPSRSSEVGSAQVPGSICPCPAGMAVSSGGGWAGSGEGSRAGGLQGLPQGHPQTPNTGLCWPIPSSTARGPPGGSGLSFPTWKIGCRHRSSPDQ